MPRIRGGEVRRRSQLRPDPVRARHLAIAVLVFVLMIGAGAGLGAKSAAGDEAAPVPGAVAGADVSPLIPFLLESGEMAHFVPGKPQVFRTAAAVKRASGESPTKLEIRRYEEGGFVEGALVRIHDRAEQAAKGISRIFEFETPTAAVAEMNAERKETFDRAALRTKGVSRYLVLKDFRVPGVPEAVGFAVVPSKAAIELGVEVGTAIGMFVEGSCLFSVGIFRPGSKEVVEPVVEGIQTISERTRGTCP